MCGEVSVANMCSEGRGVCVGTRTTSGPSWSSRCGPFCAAHGDPVLRDSFRAWTTNKELNKLIPWAIGLPVQPGQTSGGAVGGMRTGQASWRGRDSAFPVFPAGASAQPLCPPGVQTLLCPLTWCSTPSARLQLRADVPHHPVPTPPLILTVTLIYQEPCTHQHYTGRFILCDFILTTIP